MSGVLLVTGGAGFIGGTIAAAAARAGRQVRILDSLRPDVHGPGFSAPAGMEWQSMSRQQSNRSCVSAISPVRASWYGCQHSRTRASASANRSFPR